MPWTTGGRKLRLEGCNNGRGCAPWTKCWLLGISCCGLTSGTVAAFWIACDAIRNVFVAMTGLEIGCSAISCSNLKNSKAVVSIREQILFNNKEGQPKVLSIEIFSLIPATTV